MESKMAVPAPGAPAPVVPVTPAAPQVIDASSVDMAAINEAAAEALKAFVNPEPETPPEPQTPPAEGEPEVEQPASGTKPEGTPPAKAEEPEPEPEVHEVKTKAFVSLSRKEKAIRKQQEELKATRQKVEQFESMLRDANTPEGVEKVLMALGISGETMLSYFTGKVIGKKPEDPAAAALKEVQRLRGELTQRDEQGKKARAQAQQEEQAALIAEVKEGIQDTLKAGAEKFEVLGVTPDAVERVFQLKLAHFKKTGEELSDEAACQAVEDALTKETEEKLARTKKFGSRLAPAGAKPAPRSLSNVPAPSTGPKPLPETKEEATEAAMRILREAGW